MPLADHKNCTGIPTMLISLEHIYKTYPGRDEAEKVKRCIHSFCISDNIKYVMLLGDVDRFPVRYVKWTWDPVKYEKDFHTIFVPVDLYYACIFKEYLSKSFDDWDEDKDGSFGEVYIGNIPNKFDLNPDNVHLFPNIAVGRIPASTKKDVENYVSKLIYYESNAYRSSWAKSALLIATTNWVSDICKKQEYIAENLPGFITHKLYQKGNCCQSTIANGISPTEPISPEWINFYIDQGVGFVSYMGHGGTKGWGIPNGGYSTTHVQNLKNSNRLPVVVAAACDTGRFAPIPPLNSYLDTAGIPHDGTEKSEKFNATPPQPACIQANHDYDSMAEEMTMSKDTGAIAYMGSTITGNSPAPDLLKLFFKAFQDGKNILGDMWFYMVQEHYKKYAPPKKGDVTVQDVYCYLEPWRLPLFGDPSLRVGGIPH